MNGAATCLSSKSDFCYICRSQKRVIQGQLDREASALRNQVLRQKVFMALSINSTISSGEAEPTRTISDPGHRPKKSAQMTTLEADGTADRHRLYSVFSSWKLYVKERVLLKRYLVECGESPTNLSIMSTGHMREVAGSFEQQVAPFAAEQHFSFREHRNRQPENNGYNNFM